MTERYVVKNGKWGAYHYDTSARSEMPLASVTHTLNAYGRRIENLLKAEGKVKVKLEETLARIKRFEEAFKTSEQTHDQMRRSLKVARAETQCASRFKEEARCDALNLRTQLQTANTLHANQADIIRDLRARLDAQPEGPCEQQLRIIKQLRAQIEDLGGRPNVGSLTAPPVASFADILDTLRGLGWVVAIHNDYRQAGEFNTFWMFAKHGHEVHGEGKSDLKALAYVHTRIKAVERRWEMGEAIDARHKEDK